MSLVMSKRDDLFTAYLHASAKWDGEVIISQTPAYIVGGEKDEYYSQKVYDDISFISGRGLI